MRGRWAPIAIGNAVFHTVGDRLAAVKEMSISFDQLYADLGHAIGVLPYAGSAERVKDHPIWYNWWVAVADPIFRAWYDFRREQLGDYTVASDWIAYGERFTTDWPVYERWMERLASLRASAQQIGIPLTAPAPTSLPTTFPQDAYNVAKGLGNDVKDAAKEAFSLAKVLAYGALAIGGAVVVTSLVSHASNKSDPIESWARLRRGT